MNALTRSAIFIFVGLLICSCSQGLRQSQRQGGLSMMFGGRSKKMSAVIKIDGKTTRRPSLPQHIIKQAAAALFGASLLLSSSPGDALAKESAEEIPLERYFAAVAKELDPNQGESLARIKKDIDKADWEDLKLFTREYDAGFRGGVLKPTWKKLGDNKKRGIEISNSFTFDLIGLNKAARTGDKDDALKRYADIRKDVENFLLLDPAHK